LPDRDVLAAGRELGAPGELGAIEPSARGEHDASQSITNATDA
jgi:hypothetical protein